MLDLICINKDAEYAIGLHGIKYIGRPWAIMEQTKYGLKLFDVYFTKEQAESVAKFYDFNVKELDR
mgnify:FL=1